METRDHKITITGPLNPIEQQPTQIRGRHCWNVTGEINHDDEQ